jgi:hypothetical protein
MPNAKGLDWEQSVQENRNISERLDKVFDQRGPNDCWNYIRQRNRQPRLTHRGRLSFSYNGKPIPNLCLSLGLHQTSWEDR